MFREAAKVVGASDGRERDRELDEPQLLRPQVPRQDVREGEPDRADRGTNVQSSFKGNFNRYQVPNLEILVFAFERECCVRHVYSLLCTGPKWD